MKTNPNRFWAIVILLGWAFDLLFWKKPAGSNFAIYVTLALATGILLLPAMVFARATLCPLYFRLRSAQPSLYPLTYDSNPLGTCYFSWGLALTYLGVRWLTIACWITSSVIFDCSGA